MSNKEWLFSGIGVLFLTGIASIVLKIIKHRKNKSKMQTLKKDKKEVCLNQTCETCHFLILEYVSNQTGEFNKLRKKSLDYEERLIIKNLAKCYKSNKLSNIDCDFGIWDIKTFKDDNKLYERIIQNNECTAYVPYQENMTLERAKTIANAKEQH